MLPFADPQRHVLPAQRCAVPDDAVVVGDAEETEVSRLEGLRVRGVRLHRLAGGVDLVVQRDHRALAARSAIDADAGRVEQVARPVEVLLARVALRSDQDDGLLGIDREIEEPGRLFERVRTVRHDDARHLRPRKRFRDRLLQLHPTVRVHVVGRDVGEVLHLDPRDLRDLRHGRDQVLAGDGRDRRLLHRVDLHRDRAAGRDQLHHRQIRTRGLGAHRRRLRTGGRRR